MRVVVNAAMSADGKLSTREREQIAISDEADFRRVDELRAESDAVMVGVGTVVADDPSLTVDDESLLSDADGRQPARVVADSRIRTPVDAQVLDDRAETYLLVTESAPPGFVAEMEDLGATVVVAGSDRVDLPTAFAELADAGVEQLLVEGGGELIASLFAADLVDDLRVYVGPLVIGGRDAPTLADGEGFVEDFPQLTLEAADRVGEGVLLRFLPA
jgi:2,5-diamino-6-(ribosylamino)-4(3H)-pyrimidinone 5'-phosphate reductase